MKLLKKRETLAKRKSKMSRSRNIKPGFFTNELLGELPPTTRLLFVGLWLLADRQGRLENRPKRIAVELLPYDNIDPEAAISSLHDNGFVTCYEVDGNKYIQINNFQKHQTPHVKERASTIPEPDLNSTRTVQEQFQNSASNLPNPSDSLIPDSLILKTKTGRAKAAPVVDPLSLQLPENLSLEKWEEWVSYRRERKLMTASQTWKKQLTLLSKDPDPGSVIDRTITNGWQGLEYALTPKFGGKANGTRHEHLASVAAELTGRNKGERTFDGIAIEVDRKTVQPVAIDVW